MTSHFTDAQEMKKYNTFSAPCRSDLDELKEGDFVKICVNNAERLWAKIIKIAGERITGRIDNDPVFTWRHDLRYGSQVIFEKKNVYQILKSV